MAHHAIHDVFTRITTRAPFIRPIALELFCGNGMSQTVEYAHMCEYFEGWDIKEDRIASLRRNIPGARGKVCDVYEQLKRPREITEVKEFNVIVVDNHLLSGVNGHFEHFDIFPDVFKLMAPSACFLVLTVCPDPFGYAEPRKESIRKAFRYPDGFMADWDAARDRFYGLPPLDPYKLPKPRPVSAVKIESMEGIYREKFIDHGWEVPYTFSCMRSRAVGYVLVEAKLKPIEV